MERRARLAGAGGVLCWLLGGTASAGDEPARIAAAAARSTVVVDGRLDERAWEGPPFSAFVQRDPHEGAAPTEKTELRVVFAEHSLYVGIRLYDRYAGLIGRRLSRRDESPDADTVQLYLDPRRDRRSGALFEVSAAGVQRDAMIFSDSQLDFSWDAVWDSAVTVDERGWTAELRIPFSQLRFSSESSGVWGINVTRYIRRNNESDWLALVPKRESHLAARMADLTGLATIRPAPPNEVVAYALTRNGSGASPHGALGQMISAMGADMKRGIGRSLVAEATINPDFSQVEGDAAAINLTAFETFREERRPFFTESVPFFQTFGNSGGAFHAAAPTLFYSRRIGQAPAAASDSSPLKDLTATPVLGAMKLAGVMANGWKVTLLDAVGGPATASSALDIAAPPVEVAPLTNFAAGRLFRETSRGGVGVLATGVHRRVSDRSMLAPFVPDQALVGGVDGYFFVDRDQEWVVGGQMSGSYLSWTPSSPASLVSPLSQSAAAVRHALADRRKVPPPDRGGGPPPGVPGNGPPSTPPGRGNGPPSNLGNGPPSNPGNGPPSNPGNSRGTVPLAGPPAGPAGPVFGGGATSGGDMINTGSNRIVDPSTGRLGGWSANSNMHRNSGAVRVNVDAWAIAPGFEINDLGFLPRADIQGTQMQISWSKFDPDALTRFRSIDVTKGWSRTFAGETQSDTLDVSSSAVFPNYWSGGGGLSMWRRAFDATATWGGPSVLTPPGRSWWAWASTDGRHLASLDAGAYHSSNAAGDGSTSTWVSATLKPRSNVSLSVGPSFGRRVVTSQFVETVATVDANGATSPQYMFATLHADDIALTMRVNALATARLSFQVFAQSFVATGRYTGFKRLAAPATDQFVHVGADKGNIARDFDPALLSVHAVGRWEWRRGSALYVVWTQHRSGSAGADSARASQLLQPFEATAANTVLAKFTYWIGR